jgi:hypothetical protein
LVKGGEGGFFRKEIIHKISPTPLCQRGDLVKASRYQKLMCEEFSSHRPSLKRLITLKPPSLRKRSDSAKGKRPLLLDERKKKSGIEIPDFLKFKASSYPFLLLHL